MYLYVYAYNAIALNAIDISRCCVRTYGNRRKPLLCKDLGAKPALNPYAVRTYVNRRKCLLCKDLGGGRALSPYVVRLYINCIKCNCICLCNRGANLPKPLRGKDLYQLYLM
jgi:hypothetical protein